MPTNDLGQPIGEPLPEWTARPRPDTLVLEGRYCRLERLDPARHGDSLHTADQLDETSASWTYLPYGPFPARSAYGEWLDDVSSVPDPRFYAVVDTDPVRPDTAGRALGVLSYLRIFPDIGSIEVGHVHFSPLLQRRRGTTEAQYLLMRHAFDDLGYRRYEWKCDALNAPSMAAAGRLGFRYEGTFRQERVIKGRNRDTAWFSIVDAEWPQVDVRLSAWLAPDNFDDTGRQRTALPRS